MPYRCPQTSTSSRPPACASSISLGWATKETHSPAVGDRLLTAVVLTLVGQCSGHLLARWEGTFATLMEGTDPAAAADMISAACAASSAREMKVRDNDQHLGRIMLSAGVVARRSHVLREVLEAA